jgi:hypothetical protein
MSVAVSSLSAYRLPSGLAKSIDRRTASRRFTCPWIVFSHVGVFESSKSAMNTFAPELSALMIIFRSTGPVISTRRSWRSAGAGATFQVASSRTWRVSGRKSGRVPASISACRSTRRARSSLRLGSSARTSLTRRSSASGVRISSCAGASARIWTPAGMVVLICSEPPWRVGSAPA